MTAAALESAAAEAEAEDTESVSVDAKWIHLPGGGMVRLRSPRLRRACRECGVTVAELRRPPADELDASKHLGCSPDRVPAAVSQVLASAKRAMWEERIELVLEARQRGIESAAAAKKKGAGGGGAMFGADEPDDEGAPKKAQPAESNPLVVEAEEHMQKVLARHRSGTERACEELRGAWEHVAAQEKLEAETQAGAEERQSVARERSLARAERASSLHESSFQRFSESHAELLRERRRAQAERRMAQEQSAARARSEAHEAQCRLLERQANEERKRQRIAARNYEEEERKIAAGLAARAQYADSMAAAQAKAEESAALQADTNRQRDEKLQERMMAFHRGEEEEADALAARCREQDSRRTQRTRDRRRARADERARALAIKDAKSVAARSKVNAAIQARRHAEGAALSSVELKAQACAAAQARREEVQGLHAAASLVKRIRSAEHVKRMRRVEDFQREQDMKAFEERQRRAAAAVAGQRRLRQEQAAITRDLLLERSSVLQDLDAELSRRFVRRPRTAHPAGGRSRLSSRRPSSAAA